MQILKKLFASIVLAIVAALIVMLVLVVLGLHPKKAPAQPKSDFKGPTGMPNVVGPSGPPPGSL
jgi:hypothetical protein